VITSYSYTENEKKIYKKLISYLIYLIYRILIATYGVGQWALYICSMVLFVCNTIQFSVVSMKYGLGFNVIYYNALFA